MVRNKLFLFVVEVLFFVAAIVLIQIAYSGYHSVKFYKGTQLVVRLEEGETYSISGVKSMQDIKGVAASAPDSFSVALTHFAMNAGWDRNSFFVPPYGQFASRSYAVVFKNASEMTVHVYSLGANRLLLFFGFPALFSLIAGLITNWLLIQRIQPKLTLQPA